MTTLNDQFLAGSVPSLMNISGETVTYTPVGGAGVNITAIGGPIENVNHGASDLRAHWRERMFTITTDPSGTYGGVAAPGEGDVITDANGDLWIVEDINLEIYGLADLRCQEQTADQLLQQTVTYWAPSGPSATGGATFASPSAISGRWEDRNILFIDETGKETRSQSVVYLASDVKLGGYLALGDQTGTADPHAIDDAHEIKSWQKIPNKSATQFLRRAVL